MKWNIFINQLALQSIDKKLDIKDGAILSYLIDFCSADDKKIDQMDIRESGETYRYTWINYGHLIEEMPLLKFNQTVSITQRIKKLEKAGLIKAKTENHPTGKKVYIRLTEKIKELFFNSTPLIQISKPTNIDLKAHKSKLVKHNTKEEPNTISIFNFWNEKNIVNHRKLTDKMKRKIKSALKDYKLEEIKTAIDKYDTVLKDEQYFWTYRWTLPDFLARGLEKFFDTPVDNFLKQKESNNFSPLLYGD